MASRLKADRHPLLRKSKMTEPIRKKKILRDWMRSGV